MTHLDENLLVELASGSLPPERAREANAHIDLCDECRRLFSALATGAREPAASPHARGETLGRYLLLEKIGAGGMGVVYSAYDPELDRRVALKLLQGAAGEETRARLLSEAKALAKLSHPNAVTVHDVGTVGSELFLAMEFVAGTTLTRWLAEAPRSHEEILGVFRQTGEGLAAAHAAGLVHRDVKPSNILVATDGRAKIGDFGLARPVSAGAPGAPPADLVTTATGAIVGTPAYMAPEQLAGGAADARSDQFAFCVALHEALAGVRPFAGDDLASLGESIAKSARREGRSIPAWIDRVIARGLSPRPQDRFASMRDLVDALAADPAAVRRRWYGIGGAAAAAVALALGLAGVQQARSAPCRHPERKLSGVWDPERQAGIHRAFSATGKPFAEDAWTGVRDSVDAYTRQWVAMRADACEATRLRGEQSEDVLDRRMLCLDQRLDEVRSLGDVLANADADTVQKSVRAARSLTAVSGCADLAALMERVPPPKDPVVRAQVEAVRAKLADAKARRDAGRYPEALVEAVAVASSAGGIAYRPLQADALYLEADLQDLNGDAKSAESTYQSAVLAAEAGRDDEVAARALARLIVVVGSRQNRFDEGLAIEPRASAAIERMGSPDEMRALLLGATAQVLRSAARYDEALDRESRALALREKVFGPDSLEVADSLNVLANVYFGQGKYDEALARHERALAIRKARLGDRHPDVAGSLSNMAQVVFAKGDDDQAEKYDREALAIWEAALGPDSPMCALSWSDLGRIANIEGKLDDAVVYHQKALAIRRKAGDTSSTDVAASLYQLGKVEISRGNYAAAVDDLRQSLAIREKALGPEHPVTAMSLNYLAMALAAGGKPKEAIPLLQRALAAQTKVLGPDAEDIAITSNNLGDVYEAMERYRDALPAYERALAVDEKLLGPDHPDLAYDLSGVGRTHLHLHEPSKALPFLERAEKIRQGRDGIAAEFADNRFALAQALWDAGREHARAIQLATGAHDAYAKAGDPMSAEKAKTVADWLASRGGS